MSGPADDSGEGQPAARPAASGRRIQEVPASLLLPGDSPRLKGENAEHIQMLSESEVALPAILVHRETMRVVDGMHRLRATRARRLDTIEVEFFEGSSDEAFIRAVMANTEHGLPLTLNDRRAAAARIISSHPNSSDRWIAAITGLAAGTVAAIRRRAHPDEEPTAVRIGQDGRARPLSSADGRRIAADAITERPDASLREIAKVARISPATVRDVRERMRRGEDPTLAGPPGRPRTPIPADRDARPQPDRALASRAAPRNRAVLLQNLRMDPSLRFSESGRELLRSLSAWASGPSSWQELIDLTPPHCAYLVIELAQSCASQWLEFADQLEQQQRARA
jgi:ParB-like chromosome segregation protein Spo0J